MNILLTGFEPFGGHRQNASWELVRRWADRGCHVLQVPVAYALARDTVLEAITRVRPEVVIMFGQAQGAHAVRIERLAHNLQNTTRPDNLGCVRQDVPIAPEGPATYRSTLPVSALLQAITAAGITVEASTDPGRYVCNCLFYGVMHALAGHRRPPLAGFVHVPLLPEQALDCPGAPAMPLPELDAAVAAMLAALVALPSVHPRLPPANEA
ncbi:MAG: pyroglutamyl-peptidase I [Candidatus Schekmanbacteria bacterium]|nr:pyroglutamyl-peptidase I [Candidatus Schekmanbacteria bacterium]